MKNLALVVLDGNLVRDPETKKTKTEKTVTTFHVALNHEWGSKDGSKTVSYIPIETWEKTAETCAAYLKKGRHVLIEGSLRQDRWQDEKGDPHSRIKVVAQTVRFVGARPDQENQTEEAA